MQVLFHLDVPTRKESRLPLSSSQANSKQMRARRIGSIIHAPIHIRKRGRGSLNHRNNPVLLTRRTNLSLHLYVPVGITYIVYSPESFHRKRKVYTTLSLSLPVPLFCASFWVWYGGLPSSLFWFTRWFVDSTALPYTLILSFYIFLYFRLRSLCIYTCTLSSAVDTP